MDSDYLATGLLKFIKFKKNIISNRVLGQSNKTAYNFLREKSKILLVKQQLKWCEIL